MLDPKVCKRKGELAQINIKRQLHCKMIDFGHATQSTSG
jgi:hypothetical protein